MNEYKNESLVDVAFAVLSEQKGSIPFKDFYNEVAKRCEFSEEEKDENISKFFTNLSLDGRFVALKNNEWDLRKRQTFDKVHVDLNAIYEDLDDGDASGTAIYDEDNDEKILLGSDDEDLNEDYESAREEEY